MDDLKRKILDRLKDLGVDPAMTLASFLEECYGPEHRQKFIEYCDELQYRIKKLEKWK